MKDVRLYGYWRSSCSWRVRLGLNLLGIPYAYEAVHLVRDGGEQHQPEFLRLNPLAQVPVLAWKDDEGTHHLTQSLAILRFLDETMAQRGAESRLEPEGALEKARMWEVAELINAGIQPLQNLSNMQRVKGLGGDGKAMAKEVIARGFAALEPLVSQSPGPYAAGAFPTIADCCLVPQVYNARRFDVDLTATPAIARIDAACAALPAFQQARPEAQPDAQS